MSRVNKALASSSQPFGILVPVPVLVPVEDKFLYSSPGQFFGSVIIPAIYAFNNIFQLQNDKDM